MVIAICQFIQLAFQYYRKKMSALDKTIPWVKALFCLTGYCLNFLEKCIKQVSKNAYIQIALTSENFCQAAWNAFALVIKNVHRFGITHTIGAVFMIFGVFFTASCTAAISYIWLVKDPSFDLSSPIPPVICTAVIGFLIGY